MLEVNREARTKAVAGGGEGTRNRAILTDSGSER